MTSKKILSSIYENAKKVLKTMAGVNASLLKIQSVGKEAVSADYCIMIGISGTWGCFAIMSFDLQTGLALASLITGKTYEENFTEEPKSVLCELANIIIGNAMNSLDNQGFHGNLSPPAFTKGRDLSFFMPSAQTANLISLDTGVGVLKIFVTSKNK